jgi:hypothetical protein
VSVHPTARFHGLCHRATLSPLLRCTNAVWSGSDSTVRRCGSHVRSTPDCYRMLHRGLRRFGSRAADQPPWRHVRMPPDRVRKSDYLGNAGVVLGGTR